MVNSCQSDSALTRICKASLRRKCGLQRACREQAVLWSEAVRGSRLLALAGWAAWQGGVLRKPRCGVLMVTRDLSTASQMMSQHVGGKGDPHTRLEGRWSPGAGVNGSFLAMLLHTHIFLFLKVLPGHGPPARLLESTHLFTFNLHLGTKKADCQVPHETQLCFDASRTQHNLNSSFLVPREVERKYLSIGLGADAGSGKLSNLPRTQHPGMWKQQRIGAEGRLISHIVS